MGNSLRAEIIILGVPAQILCYNEVGPHPCRKNCCFTLVCLLWLLWCFGGSAVVNHVVVVGAVLVLVVDFFLLVYVVCSCVVVWVVVVGRVFA